MKIEPQYRSMAFIKGDKEVPVAVEFFAMEVTAFYCKDKELSKILHEAPASKHPYSYEVKGIYRDCVSKFLNLGDLISQAKKHGWELKRL